MATTLRIVSTEDAASIERIFARSDVTPPDILARAAQIVQEVRQRGDAAVAELTLRYEGRRPFRPGFEIPASRWDDAAALVAPEVAAALEHAARRIARFHEQQRERGVEVEEDGIRLGTRVEPLARVGVYVPGGTARYPSSVLMTAVPARVAGVGEIVMVTPGASPETLRAARIAGVDRVFEIGGAQAVAALAYGTETVPRVDKIVGPGNIWVAAAKRLVFGDVGIDSIAGPSEVLVIADDSAIPAHVAADLLAQAEHDADASAILVTPSRALAEAVAAEVDRQLATLQRPAAAASIRDHGAAVVAPDLGAAVRLANRFAPEHLELHVRDAARVAEGCRTAGAIFVGPFTPEAAGDYLAGPNHVLPTGGAARYASPLGVWDYVKRTSILEYRREGLVAHARDIELLAGVEGLPAHARSVSIRTREEP
jgi:histidinol dehydrogenase